MSDICNLCLGDDTEVPPFGTIQDARNIIHPCDQCSLVTHEKCLLDWFNSLPSNKLHIIDSSSLTDVLREGVTSTTTRTPLTHEHEIAGIGNDTGPTEIHINLNTSNINNWVNRMMNPSSSRSSGSFVLLLAPCPQCKKDIVFSMKRNPLLAANSGLRSILSTGLSCSGMVLTLTSAITGVLSMGYIGLTSCGLKMMGSMVPEPLLYQLLTKHALAPKRYLSLFKDTNLDSLENALTSGVIDPFKFSRIPILPIMMYRMRQSSFVNSWFSKDVSGWFSELMINLYFSSLGNNQLARSVYENILSNLTSIIRRPFDFYKYLNLFKGIDFNDINNLVALVVPLRWAYDIFYRFTINQLNFHLAMKMRPRTIADNFTEYGMLETLSNNAQELRSKLVKEHQPVGLRCRLSLEYIHVKALIFSLKLKASMKHDYSGILSYKSFSIRCLTTVLWPFLSSKVGEVIFKAFKNHTDADRVISNLIGLVVVVLIKDLGNVWLNYLKLRQLTKLQVLNFNALEAELVTDLNSRQIDDMAPMPGGFEY